VNLLPDRYAKFVIIQWITCVHEKHDENCDTYISKLFLTKMQVKFSIFFHPGSLNVIGDKFRFVRSKLIMYFGDCKTLSVFERKIPLTLEFRFHQE
jgi:hypothetical protein